jgi:glycosyltransferase involved in cell wall biosynthesis
VISPEEQSYGKRRRVLVVTSTFPRWTGDREPPFVFELCKRLANYADVHVLAPHGPGARSHEIMESIEVTRFRYFFTAGEKLAYEGGIISSLRQHAWRYVLVPFFLLSELAAIVRMLRQHEVDVIHAHWMFPQGFLALLAVKLAGSEARVLCTSHGADLFGLKNSVFEKIKRYTARRCAALTVVSEAMKEKIKSYGIASDKIRVLPMGVDLTHTFVPADEPVRPNSLLFVGRLVEKKGLEYLLRAVAIVRKKLPDVTLDCVGSGPLLPELQALARSLSVDDIVTFHGSVTNTQLPEFYQSHGIVVFPSVIADSGDQEGFGLVLVEALGCGCAVVVTDLPAMRDIVSAESAIIVEQKNVSQLAGAIEELVQAPAQRKKLAEKGRQHVIERYDWNIVAKKYAEIINSM